VCMWWCLVAVVGAAIVCVRLSGSVQNSYIVERIPSPWQKKKKSASLLAPFRLEVSYLVQNRTFLYLTFPSYFITNGVGNPKENVSCAYGALVLL
jgi:hypothetical protein